MRLGLSRSILGLAGSSLSQIGLMALPLCVCQVVSLVIVKCQTQLTLVTTRTTTTNSKSIPSLKLNNLINQIKTHQSNKDAIDLPAQVVPHEIRIFGQIDGLQGQPPEPLPPVDGLILSGGGAAAAGLRTPFSVHDFDEVSVQIFALGSRKKLIL